MKLLKYLLITISSIIWFNVSAQTSTVIEQEEQEFEDHVFDCYQTFFLDSDLESVQEVKSDGKQIQFEFIPDKKQLILHDYQGKGTIECFGTSKEGESKEFMKSSCYIDPCENAL